jgi:hypothetical protein
LLAAIDAGSAPQATAAAQAIAGLGPGLTPAGDDFLVGVLLAGGAGLGGRVPTAGSSVGVWECGRAGVDLTPQPPSLKRRGSGSQVGGGSHGLTVALTHVHTPPARPYSLTPTLLADSAAPLTTHLSAAYLRAAARGECSAPWHALFAALGGGRRAATLRAVAGLLAVGHTSGADALAGFLAARPARRALYPDLIC